MLQSDPCSSENRRAQKFVGHNAKSNPENPQRNSNGLRDHGTPLLLCALTLALTGAGCKPKTTTPSLDPATCRAEIDDVFGAQNTAVVALRPVDGGALFRPEVLEAIDRVCQAFEDQQVDYDVMTKCLTNVPLMEARPGGARLVLPRDELPVDVPGAAHLQALMLELEFAVGDVLDSSGTRSYIHLNEAMFDGVDLRALLASQQGAEPTLEMAIDLEPRDLPAYRKVAGTGPSRSAILGLLDTGEDGGIKEPLALHALDRFQAVAEGTPRVAQSFTIVDDLKVTRRGLRRGNPAEAIIPPKRAEVAQLLLAMGMGPTGDMFGPRIDSAQRVALVRVNLMPTAADQRRRIVKRLSDALALEAPEGARALICAE